MIRQSGQTKLRNILVTAAVISFAMVGGSPVAFASDEAKSPAAPSGKIVVENGPEVPALSREQNRAMANDLDLDVDTQRRVPLEVHEELFELYQSGQLDDVNNLVWNSGTRQLTIHMSPKATNRGDDIVSALKATGAEASFAAATDRFPRETLERLSEKIARAGASSAKDRVAYAAPKVDGSGITVGVEGLQESRRPAVANLLQATVGSDVPVDVHSTPALSATASRLADASPWSGGARISSSKGGCSSGFGMGIPTVPPAYTPVMLFADHCSGAGQVGQTWKSYAGVTIGSTIATPSGGTDLQLISMSSGSGLMYVGTPLSSSTAKVRGAIMPVVGDFWCLSGSRSGTVCGAEVKETGMTGCMWIDTTLICYSQQVKTVQADGIPSGGNGDSGGPAGYLYLNTSTNEFNVYAAGIISAMTNEGTTCTGDPSTATRKCSATMFMAPIKAIYDNYPGGIGILTRN